MFKLLTKAAFTRKLKFANSCWQSQVDVCERDENALANCWRQIELASILANFFTNFSC